MLPLKTFLPVRFSLVCTFVLRHFLVPEHLFCCLPLQCLFPHLIPPPSDLLLALSLIPGCRCCSRPTRCPLFFTLIPASCLCFSTPPSLSAFPSLPFLEPIPLSFKFFCSTTCPLSVQHGNTHYMHFLPGVESPRFSCLSVCSLAKCSSLL